MPVASVGTFPPRHGRGRHFVRLEDARRMRSFPRFSAPSPRRARVGRSLPTALFEGVHGRSLRMRMRRFGRQQPPPCDGAVVGGRRRRRRRRRRRVRWGGRVWLILRLPGVSVSLPCPCSEGVGSATTRMASVPRGTDQEPVLARRMQQQRSGRMPIPEHHSKARGIQLYGGDSPSDRRAGSVGTFLSPGIARPPLDACAPSKCWCCSQCKQGRSSGSAHLHPHVPLAWGVQ